MEGEIVKGKGGNLNIESVDGSKIVYEILDLENKLCPTPLHKFSSMVKKIPDAFKETLRKTPPPKISQEEQKEKLYNELTTKFKSLAESNEALFYIENTDINRIKELYDIDVMNLYSKLDLVIFGQSILFPMAQPLLLILDIKSRESNRKVAKEIINSIISSIENANKKANPKN
jgi:hypothetical protein